MGIQKPTSMQKNTSNCAIKSSYHMCQQWANLQNDIVEIYRSNEHIMKPHLHMHVRYKNITNFWVFNGHKYYLHLFNL